MRRSPSGPGWGLRASMWITSRRASPPPQGPAFAAWPRRLLDEAPQPAGGDASAGSAFDRDGPAAGRELARLDPEQDILVAYVGKLIVSKGVDLLLAAWPLVLARVPRARLVVIGFGAYRDGL